MADRSTHVHSHDERTRIKRGAAATSIAVNIGLSLLKVVVGVITGSIALWASAADSFLDLTASLFAYIGVRIGSRPPDDTHAYGHEKFESLSSLVQLGALFLTVGIIAVEAIERLGGTSAVDVPLLGVAVIVFSLLVDWWISRKLLRAAAESGGSQALEADALHFTTDVWSNIAVLIGLVAAGAGWPIADPIAALVVAFFVAITAIGLLRRTAGVLTDKAPNEDIVRRIAEVIHSFPEVHEHHTLRARMVGSRIFLDVCVELDADLTFERAHNISHEMQDSLRVAVPDIADAVIHFEPAGHPEHQDEDHHAHGFDALSVDGDR
ncbi:MAG: cation diffusion facilitator family transporter [Actinobacteria bacterium]|nr:cation diffusion facilitator family transporter [Actinomycetota bacterium]